MTSLRHLSTLALASLTLFACKDKQAAPTMTQPNQVVAQTHTEAPVAELNTMDPRTPVPLLPMMAWHQKQNMQEHLVAIQQIIGAAAVEDWDAAAKASALIESSPQMQKMCHHMGMGANGFTEVALDFHRRADEIGKAAAAHDMAAVLKATSNTLLACTGCHAAYRQDVVDAETWKARTGSTDLPGGAMHGGGHGKKNRGAGKGCKKGCKGEPSD